MDNKTSAHTKSVKHDIRIRHMNLSDVAAVSVIHMRVLPTTIARIGKPYLSRIYTQLLRDPPLHTTLVAYSGSSIMGVITATRDVGKTQQQLRTILFHPWAIWMVWRALLFNRITIAEIVDRISTERQIRLQFPAPYATILTFFVDAPYQHRSIGKRLLRVLQEQLSSYTKLHVDTEISNTRAQQWYSAHGFRTLKTIGNTVIFCQK